MLKRCSLLECCVTVLVGTCLVARKQLIRSVNVQVRNLTNSYVYILDGNKTAINLLSAI